MVDQYSVLVVDDDENLAHAMSPLLRAHGCKVFTAFDGFQCYAEYFNHPTEFVVTDIQMPAMDGFEMMRCIRSINPNVKTIYVSGALERFEKDVESEGRQFDVAGLLKPISTTALLTLMSTDFDRARESYGGRPGRLSNPWLRMAKTISG
jgi:DNA-binding NtrC family response regulator